ncbi:MAG TPA: helicase associated domain-containing protein [Candidatus Lumbricidophila sp.]|nr:helicase associated domain-containing protein [Candidatus Lumbricidophila sp.]
MPSASRPDRKPRLSAWDKALLDAVAYVEITGSFPRRRVLNDRANASERELRIVSWIQYQRRLSSKGDLKPERREQLDKQLPGWDTAGTQEETWLRNFTTVVKWIQANKRWPSLNIYYTPASELKLARWLHIQRRRQTVGKLEQHRLEQLDKYLPGWRGSVEDQADDADRAGTSDME